MKMKFSEEDEFGLRRLLKGFQLFRRGRRRKIENIMHHSTFDRKTFVFDYTYVTGKNNSNKYHRQSVMFLNSKNLGLPQFSMKPENLWHQLTDWLRITSDIDFESHPDFSEKYFLTSENEQLIRYLFDKDVLDFFTVQKNWYVEGVNYYLIIYSLNERLHPKIIESFVNMGNKLYELLRVHPEWMKLDHPL